MFKRIAFVALSLLLVDTGYAADSDTSAASSSATGALRTVLSPTSHTEDFRQALETLKAAELTPNQLSQIKAKILRTERTANRAWELIQLLTHIDPHDTTEFLYRAIDSDAPDKAAIVSGLAHHARYFGSGGEITRKDILKKMKTQIDQADLTCARIAYETLIRFCESDDLPVYMGVVTSDAHPTLRGHALLNLVEHRRYAPAVAFAKKVLKDTNEAPEVIQCAMIALLVNLGADCVPHLEPLLEHPDQNVRRDADNLIKHAKRISSPEAKP